jgi:hypothetical protein
LREERRERRRRGCDVGGRRIWHEEALGVALDVVRVAELLRVERKGQLRMLLVDEQGGGCAVAVLLLAGWGLLRLCCRANGGSSSCC